MTAEITYNVFVEYEGEDEDGEDYIGEDVEVEFEYDYCPGEPASFRGHPDNWHDGDPGWFDILGARTYAFGRWYDLDLGEVLSFVDASTLQEAVEDGREMAAKYADYEDRLADEYHADCEYGRGWW